MSAILHSTEGAEERFERAIQWLRDNYQDHNIASLCDGLRAVYGSVAPSGWQPIATRPRDVLGEGTYLIANRRGQVAPVVCGVIQNNVGTPNDWDYGTNATLWMPLPPAPNQGEAS